MHFRNSTQPFPWTFFVLTFAITWLLWSPGILLTIDAIDLPVPFTVFFFLGTWGPFLAACIVTFREAGWGAVKRFWRRGFDTHISGKWLFVIVLIPLLVAAVPLGAYLMSGGVPPELSVLSQPWMILPIFLTYLFTGGGNEEWGWRGFALDRLQLRWSPLVASLILGVIWGLWHLPLFFIAYTGQFHMSLVAFLLATPALSVLHTWVYNGSGRNLLAAWLFHAALGTAWEVFPIVQPQLAGYEWVHRFAFLAVVIVAIVVVAARGSRLGDREPVPAV